MSANPGRLVGWKYGAFIGGLVGAIALAMYPIAVDPYMNPKQWSEYLNFSFSFGINTRGALTHESTGRLRSGRQIEATCISI